MSSSAVSSSEQERNRKDVERQASRVWDTPKDPHDPRTIESADWKRQAKNAGLIE